MATDATRRLAVYGTLAPGRSNHDQLAGLDGRWVDGTVRGIRYASGWGAAVGYPGLVLDINAEPVAVQVFESDDLPTHWGRLDEFEGDGYRRVVTVVDTADGDLAACIYVLVEQIGESAEPIGVSQIVVAMFDAMQARDWERVGELIDPDAEIEFAHTGERFDGLGYVAMNRDYPEGWSLIVTPLVESNGSVVANIVVTHGDTVFDCVALYSISDGRIVAGREWWLDRGQEPPAWRAPYIAN